MTEFSDRYRQRADHFEQKLSAIPSDAWEKQSPCEEWDTRGVLTHVVESSSHFLGYVDARPSPDPTTEEDPMGAWRTTRNAVQTALESDSANSEVDTSFGKSTFGELVDRYLSFDLVVHSWDIARAAGIDDSIDPVLVTETTSMARELAPVGRKMGAFGSPVDPQEGESEQAQLLAIVGRTQ